MKINPVLLGIALAIAALSGYGFFAANSGKEYQLVLSIGAGLVLFITLSGVLAVSSKDGSGSTTNIRVLSGVFFFAILIEQLIFCFVPFRLPPYIILTGILILIYVLIAYAIRRALQSG